MPVIDEDDRPEAVELHGCCQLCWRCNGRLMQHWVGQKGDFYPTWTTAWSGKKIGSIFNQLPRGHVGSLQRQGCTNKHHGIRLRPILNDAGKAVDAINGISRQSDGPRFTGLSSWPYDDQFFGDLWEETSKFCGVLLTFCFIWPPT